MALVKLAEGSYNDDPAVSDVINYITRPAQYSEIFCNNLVPGSTEDMIQQIYNCQYAYGKTSGKRIYHFIIAFDDRDHLDTDLTEQLFSLLFNKYFSEYQCIAAIHRNTDNPHIHFAFNPVNIYTGLKFSRHYSFFNELQTGINTIV
ncbi:MAG: relaxase/mobilization nuclease domain-containing protein [Firmicutes bacterium]|nr:relaxase/mobilization nuclease domain-containing protein [Bacillota bacterium]